MYWVLQKFAHQVYFSLASVLKFWTFLQNLWVRSEGFDANTARGKNDSEPPLRLSNLHRQKICCVSGTQDEFVIECSFWFGAMLVG